MNVVSPGEPVHDAGGTHGLRGQPQRRPAQHQPQVSGIGRRQRVSLPRLSTLSSALAFPPVHPSLPPSMLNDLLPSLALFLFSLVSNWISLFLSFPRRLHRQCLVEQLLDISRELRVVIYRRKEAISPLKTSLTNFILL